MTALTCHPGLGSPIRGIALVASDDFSARYDLDLTTGVFSRRQHRLFGRSCAGRILVLNTGKGGVASAWMLREIAQSQSAPLGFLFNRANPILVQGTAFAGITLCDRFDAGDVTTLIPDGAVIEVKPSQGIVSIVDKAL